MYSSTTFRQPFLLKKTFLLILLSLILVIIPTQLVHAQATLTIEMLTWDIIGLDSNSPTDGPSRFPVGARVCTNIAITNLDITMSWQSTNTNIDFRAGSLSTVSVASLAAGACTDAYFEIEVNQVAAAFDTTREYVITATEGGGGSVSTPQPRELYVEYLISQNRNAIQNVAYGPTGGPLTDVAAGGGMSLLVGNTYDIELTGSTATQGYEQFESFITLSNSVFQINSVSTDYTANTSSNVTTNGHTQLYADACTWDSDPNSPNYRDCLSTGKSGGDVVTTYNVTILSGGGSTETLNTLLYDFSGSSFHYNADFSSESRLAHIIDPSSADISKSFSPSTTNVGGVSTLIITLSNSNTGALSGYNFTDTLPGDMQVANPTNASTSGCGSPTFSPHCW